MNAVYQTCLRDVATIERSIIAPARIVAGTNYVGLENIETGGRFVGVRPVHNGELASSKFSFTAHHVLYGKLRPYLAKIARPDFDGICSTDILPILPGPDLDRGYLAWILLSPALIAFASSRATGANLPRLRPSALGEMRIPLPPLPEQQRIAEILDKADALRAKRRAALAKLEELTQSIFLDMFGDPIVTPRLWPLTELCSLGSVDRGVSKHRPRNAPELLGGPYPFVQTGDVANCDGYIRTHAATYSEVGLRQSKLWPAGTLCITIAANIAKTGILTFDACFPDSVVGFMSSEPATVEFVRILLSFHQQRLEQLAPESAQKNINLKVLRHLRVPSVPAELRRGFAQRLQMIERMRGGMAGAYAQGNALFASLQHQAFRGEL